MTIILLLVILAPTLRDSHSLNCAPLRCRHCSRYHLGDSTGVPVGHGCAVCRLRTAGNPRPNGHGHVRISFGSCSPLFFGEHRSAIDPGSLFSFPPARTLFISLFCHCFLAIIGHFLLSVWLFPSAHQVFTWSMALTTPSRSGRASDLLGGTVAFSLLRGMTVSGARAARCRLSVGRRSWTTLPGRRDVRTRTTAPVPLHLPHVPGLQSVLRHFSRRPRRPTRGRMTTSRQPQRLPRRRRSLG
jgi:hypothetical protein